MIDKQQTTSDLLVEIIQPRKIITHFDGDISEIKRWAERSTDFELMNTINAFKHEGLNEYVQVLSQVYNERTGK
jgi:hypothetical protein